MDTLKIQHFSFYDPTWNISGNRDFIERIGASYGFFDPGETHACFYDGPYNSLCTFKNSEDSLNVQNDNCYELPVSISDHTEKDKVILFPNPVDNVLNIQSPESIKLIRLYRNDGQLISIYPRVNDIDLSSYSSGYYFIELFSDSNMSYRYPFIKK